MSRGWVEIWTRPGSATFEAVIVDPPIQSASFTRTLSGIGRGELVLPADYDRVDDIILTDLAVPANNVRTLVRVFLDDGTATPVVAYEFYADQLERVEGPDNLVSITGPGVESAMGDARVEPYDWDGTANFQSEFPDWVWGGIDVMRSISVAGLARVPDVWEIGTDGTGGTFTLTLNANATAAIAYNASYNALEGAVQATDLGNVDAIVDGGEGTIDQPWRLAINLPLSGNTLSANFADVTGDTEQVFAQVQTGGYDGANIDGWTVAQFADSRATPQLFGTYDTPALRVVTTGLPAGATYGIEVRGASQFAGTQKVMNVTPGGLYHARLTFRTPSGTDQFRIVVRDPVADGEATPIAAYPVAGGQFTVTANTVTSIDLDSIVIPEGTSQIIFRVAYVGTGDPDTFDVFPELSYFREGQPPATVGDIMIQLLEDADGTDHPAREVWRDAADAFTWVDYSSFTDALDSNGDAWQDAELSVTVKRGKPYDKVLADFVGLGYEWELIPDGANPGVWLLNVYNTDGIGTDRTALATPQIFGEESVGGARMYRRHPPASNVAVEGSSQLSARISSVGAVTAYGLRESYVPDLDITTLADAGLKATQTITGYLRKSQPLTLARQPRDVDPFPFIQFQLGDTVNVSEPPFMEKDGRRLVQVVWALTGEGETVAESYGAVTFTGQAAVNQGVFQLLDRFEPIRLVDGFVPVVAGGGGVIPWLVAASDSPDTYKAVAGWQCTGTDDQDVVQAAHDAVAASSTSGGEVWLSPGNYSFTWPSSGPCVDAVNSGVRLVGVGEMFSSYILVDGVSGSSAVFDRWNGGAENIYMIDGSSGSGPTIGFAPTSPYGRFQSCWIEMLGYAIRTASAGLVVEACHLESYGQTASSAAVRVQAGGLGGWLVDIRDCDIVGAEIGIDIYNGGAGTAAIESRIHVSGNRVKAGIGLQVISSSVRLFGAVITGNGFTDPTSPPTSTRGMVHLDNVDRSVIADNVVYLPLLHGIELVDCVGVVVVGNVIVGAGVLTTHTFDGIILSGNTDECSVQSNKVVPSVAVETTRYGVNVSAATCDNNVVADNFLGDASVYGTGAYNNAGTGTITARDGNGQFTY